MKKILLTSLILFSFNTVGEISPEITALNEGGRLERFQQGLNRYSGLEDYGSLTGKKLLLTRKSIGMLYLVYFFIS